MAAIINDRFIVDGYQYQSLPISFDRVHDNSYGVRRMSYPNLQAQRQVVSLGPSKPTNSDSFAYHRKSIAQAFRASWDGNDARCDLDLYNTLTILDSIQKTFYLQFDELMSYDLSHAPILVPFGNSLRAYFAPTWPIKPLGWTPLNGYTWDRCVFINRQPVPTSLFTVDETAGMIQFVGQLAETDVVQLCYTWRMYAQIAALDLHASASVPAQDVFQGSVIFEQVVRQDGSSDRWLGDFPTTVDTSSNTPSLSAPQYTAIASSAVNATEELTNANLSGESDVTNLSVDSLPQITNSTLPTAGSADPTWGDPTYGPVGSGEA